MNYSLNVTLVIMLFPFIAGLGAFMLMVKPLHSRTFRQIINGTSNIRWNRLFTSMLVWLALSALYFFIYMKIDPGNFTLKNTGSQVIILIIISVTMIPFQAALEEILFRGYFMQGFALTTKRAWAGICISAGEQVAAPAGHVPVVRPAARIKSGGQGIRLHLHDAAVPAFRIDFRYCHNP